MSEWEIYEVKGYAWLYLKQQGHNILGQMKGNYAQALIMTFFFALVSGLPSTVVSMLGLSEGGVGIPILILLTVLVVYPMEVGMRQYYLWQKRGMVCPQEALLSPFKKERFTGIFTGMFFYGVLISLWSLLLIVPGVIKAYSWRMVPYLLAENPRLSWKRALQISENTTRGEKLDMFVLDMSFIGWFLLGIITCGIGIVFLLPYYHTAMCEVYLYQRKKAIKNGWARVDELYSDLTMEFPQ